MRTRGASVTGELKLDYANGLAVMNAPCAQAPAGFLSKAGKIELDDVIVESGNEYGSVLVVSLDGKPLTTSRRILVQIATEERNFGFQTEPGSAVPRGSKQPLRGNKIVKLGGPPLGVRKFAGNVTVKTSGAKVLALDCHGYLVRELAGRADGGTAIHLLDDCLYYVVEK